MLCVNIPNLEPFVDGDIFKIFLLLNLQEFHSVEDGGISWNVFTVSLASVGETGTDFHLADFAEVH